jgi:hypothetical protein
VRVEGQGRGRLLMAELVGYVSNRGASGAKVSRVGMAKVVEPKTRQARGAEKRAKPLGHSCGVQGSARIGREDPRGHIPPGHEGLGLDLCLPLAQCLRSLGVISTMRLSSVLVGFTRPPDTARSIVRERASHVVYVFPPQCESLGADITPTLPGRSAWDADARGPEIRGPHPGSRMPRSPATESCGAPFWPLP